MDAILPIYTEEIIMLKNDIIILVTTTLADTLANRKWTSWRPISSSAAWMIVFKIVVNVVVLECCRDIKETTSIKHSRNIQSFVENGRMIAYDVESVGGCLK